MNRQSLCRAFFVLLKRDLKLALRHPGECVHPLLFFVLVVCLFPLALGVMPELLARIAPGVIWVAALLVSLLSLDGIFRSDFEDGSLEQLLLSVHPLPILVLAKVSAHWLVTGLPLLVIAPVLADMQGMAVAVQGILLLTILIGTPILSLLGAIGIALTIGLRQGGMMLSIVTLPLYIPVLIFATSAIDSTALGLSASAQINILLSFLFIALSLSPWATAAALKMSLS